MNHQSNPLPIGVFDSGMGGLTVLRSLKSAFPEESFVYLGDTARLPYGTKSEATIVSYAAQMAGILINHGVKLLVVACNTASTVALTYLQERFPEIPIIGVVEPGARAAVSDTRNQRIVVLATETTIAAGGYQTLIQRMNPKAEIMTQPCGLFVALAEEGWVDNDVTLAAVRRYLDPIMNHPNAHDCVVLGCTHFPVLLRPLRQVLGEAVRIVDSAVETALAVKTILDTSQLRSRTPASEDRSQFFVTDLPARFIRIGEIFLGEAILPHQVQLI